MPRSGSERASGDHFKTQHPDYADISNKLPTLDTVAVVTDIEEGAPCRRAVPRRRSRSTTLPALLTLWSSVSSAARDHGYPGGRREQAHGAEQGDVPSAGRPLIQAGWWSVWAPICRRPAITTNEPERLDFLHAEFPQYRIQLVRDAFNVRGAAGLY